MSDGPATEATCRACGSGFVFDLAFYVARSLSEPGACPSCLQARRRRMLSRTGQMVLVRTGHPNALVVIESDGVRFAAHPPAPFEIGAMVEFEHDPEERLGIGRLPFACRVCVAGDPEVSR